MCDAIINNIWKIIYSANIIGLENILTKGKIKNSNHKNNDTTMLLLIGDKQKSDYFGLSHNYIYLCFTPKILCKYKLYYLSTAFNAMKIDYASPMLLDIDSKCDNNILINKTKNIDIKSNIKKRLINVLVSENL